jgi:GntR family transcriptional regulator
VVFLGDVHYQAPLYRQIESMIRNRIKDQEFIEGEKIPSERDLANEFQVSRMTVKHAINALVQEGMLYRSRGSGTFVGYGPRHNYQFTFAGVNSLSAALKRTGRSVTTRVLKVIEDCQSPYLNAKLALLPDQKVFGLHRLRLADGVPFAAEYTYVPSDLFPDFLQIDFRKVGLYDYMSSKDHKPETFQQYQTAMKPLQSEAKLLKLDLKSDFVFKLLFTSADKRNNLVEFTESYLNPQIIDLNYEVNL